jgi:hypothetical protein
VMAIEVTTLPSHETVGGVDPCAMPAAGEIDRTNATTVGRRRRMASKR